MKMVKNLILFVLAILLIDSCMKKCPDDEIGHNLTETELDWFSCAAGDTLLYRDALSNETFYLTCVSSVTGGRDYWVPTDNCKDGGYVTSFKTIFTEFSTNFIILANMEAQKLQGTLPVQ